MNKIEKSIKYIFVCVAILCYGFYIPVKQKNQNANNSFVSPNKINYSNFSNGKNEEVFSNLNGDEIITLEEHLFGQWRFSERIIELNESQNTVYDTTYNISGVGSEELKKNVILYYDKDWVQFVLPVSQNTFSSAKDMFLFGKNGGFSSVKEPIYYVEKMESNVLNLNNVCIDGQNNEVEFLEAEQLIAIKYYVQYELDSDGTFKQGKVGENFGSTIYFNPIDKNTIYVDFCGLWRMERDDSYYGPSGKSEY